MYNIRYCVVLRKIYYIFWTAVSKIEVNKTNMWLKIIQLKFLENLRNILNQKSFQMVIMYLHSVYDFGLVLWSMLNKMILYW